MRTIDIADDGTITCARCRHRLRRANENHPKFMCLLWEAGFDAEKEVREAAKHLPPAVPPFVSRPVSYPSRSLRSVKEGAS